MVHGYDIPLEREDAFRRASDRAARILASLGMALIPAATNVRVLPGDWGDVHGAALAFALMMLQGGFSTGVVAGSYAYHRMVLQWGSNPLTDALLSSDAFRICHDGAGYDRIAKVREIGRWEEARRYLRVCWAGPEFDRNCCRCFKCVRTMLAFRVTGNGLPQCFERDISNWDILKLAYPSDMGIRLMRAVLENANRASITPPWVRALQMSVLLNRLGLQAKKTGLLRGPGRK
jgi:hypothetical protein